MKRPSESTSLKELSRLMLTMKSESELNDFLHSMLTPRERQNLALRWELVKLLNQGVQQRLISEKLGVSLCKITRGSHELKHG